MFNKERWNEILQALTSNVFRTIMTSFGVFWGIFILILLLAAGKGLENGVKQGFGDIATNTMFVWTQSVSMPYKGMPKGRRFSYRLNDVKAIQDNVPNLRFISPRNQLGGFGGSNNVVHGLNSGAFNVYGDYPEIIKQEPMDITSGRFINYNDINEARKVCIIGQGVQNELYEKGESVLNTLIKINGVNFTVIGTYKKKSNNGDGEEAQKQIFVPFTAFSQAFNRADRVGWMAITAVDGTPITEIKNQVFDVLKERHSIHPEDNRAIGHFDLYQEFKKVEGLFAGLRFVAYLVGFLILISGIIGITNIMLIVVKERTKEIGIRRALGASPWNIRGQILLESIFLTIISGMGGIVFGTFIIFIINKALESVGPVDMFANPSVNLPIVLTALFILIFFGLLAGFIPAQNAIKVKPVDALRSE
jgi:putative ABC transport system permease protein